MKLQLLLEEERRKGLQEGRELGRESLVFEMVRDSDITPEIGAKKLACSLEDFQEKMEAYLKEPAE